MFSSLKPAIAAAPPGEEIPAEVLAAITAAITVFLGRNVRIRSLEKLHTHHESASRWTRQGRTLIEASHNLRTRPRINR